MRRDSDKKGQIRETVIVRKEDIGNEGRNGENYVVNKSFHQCYVGVKTSECVHSCFCVCLF